MKIDIVVTRHKGLVEYLIDEGIISADTEISAHATPDLVRGKRVLGVLPHSLSCLTESFSEVPLALTAADRGQELSADRVREIAGALVTYKIRVIK